MRTPALFLIAAAIANAQLERADSLRLRGDYAAAEREYLRVVAASPDDRAGLSGLAAVYLQTGRAPQAVVLARRLVETARAQSGAHSLDAAFAMSLLGTALMNTQNLDEAQRSLESAATSCAQAIGAEHMDCARIRAN